MSHALFTSHTRWQVARAVGIALAMCVWSADAANTPNVTAVLDNAETFVGEPVQLQIKVNGSRNANAPSIAIEGLDIHYDGPQEESRYSFGPNGLTGSSTVTHNYTIVAAKPGAFKIPSQAIDAGGTALKTPELTLNVRASGGRGTRSLPNGRSDPVNPNNVGFAELVIAKPTAYVGEMVPVQVRIAIDANVQVDNSSISATIDLPGQGFTAQKMPPPSETRQTIRGQTYNVLTYRTAIAAARTGKLEIGPIEFPLVALLPQTNRNRASRRDPFSLNDPFDNFFNNPAFAMSVPRQVKVRGESATLEVKALPPKAPPGFSGAVGNFTLVTDAKPKAVQVGDPITITAKLTGRGNFDRVAAPEFDDEKGWHKYPPSSDFKQDDDVGISGVKTFETVLSPNERKEKLPASVFSFFDPVKEQYVTLRSEQIPIRIEGSSAPAAAPVTSAPTNASPTTAPAVKDAEILHQLPDLAATTQTFTPIFARPGFWLAQLIPLLALFGFIGWRIRSVRLGDREAVQRAAWQQETAELERNLRREGTPPSEYVADARRAVQLRAALAKKLDPNVIDASMAASALRLDEAKQEQLRQLFARADEMRYSGSANGAGTLVPEERREVLELVESLRV